MTCLLSLSLGTFLANAQKAIPDYSQTDRKDIPAEYKWKIEDLYASDQAWEADKKMVTSQIGEIPVRAKDWLSSAAKMLDFLQFTDNIGQRLSRLSAYSSNQANMDIGDAKLQSMNGELRNLGVDYGTKMAFFNTDVLNFGEKKFAEYLKMNPGLEPYKFSVAQIFRNSAHILPPEQDKLVSMTSLFTGATSQASSLLNNLELPPVEVKLSDGKEVQLNIANYSNFRSSKNPADRKLVMHSFWAQHAKFENTFAALIDGKMKQHLYYSKVYKYTDCLESRLFSEDINPAVYHTLITSVRSGLPLLQRYITLKKQLLKLDTFHYDDIYASAVKSVDKKYTWDEACKLVRTATTPLGPEYAKALEVSLTKGWIDIYPNKGKESGAYSSGVYGAHPYVKMNYNGDYNAVSTLAHELGHAMHSHFSNLTQPYATADYATFLAEIASTFNENLLMHEMLKEEKDDLFKLYILDNYLDQVRGTIFRQTLFAEFELAMHQKVEGGQSLTADWLNENYLKLTREYYGADKGVMEVGEYIGNEWSFIPHFYMNYYVFQYSTGLIASMALSESVLKGGPAERDRYLELLKSGGKDFPLNLLKKAGVDMTSPEPAKAAMKNFESLISEMEQIVARLKAAGKI